MREKVPIYELRYTSICRLGTWDQGYYRWNWKPTVIPEPICPSMTELAMDSSYPRVYLSSVYLVVICRRDAHFGSSGNVPARPIQRIRCFPRPTKHHSLLQGFLGQKISSLYLMGPCRLIVILDLYESWWRLGSLPRRQYHHTEGRPYRAGQEHFWQRCGRILCTMWRHCMSL